MDDLVEALKAARNNSPQPDDYLDQLLTEAADEIDSLRRRIAELEK